LTGKRVHFHPEVFARLKELADDRAATFQELADEAFDDLLKKHKKPVGVRAMLKASAAEKSMTVRRRHLPAGRTRKIQSG
jgi:hypothetical protein